MTISFWNHRQPIPLLDVLWMSRWNFPMLCSIDIWNWSTAKGSESIRWHPPWNYFMAAVSPDQDSRWLPPAPIWLAILPRVKVFGTSTRQFYHSNLPGINRFSAFFFWHKPKEATGLRFFIPQFSLCPAPRHLLESIKLFSKRFTCLVPCKTPSILISFAFMQNPHRSIPNVT